MNAPLRLCMMPDLLFLAPCLPYPPDRGDRLRWFQMLRFLGQHFRVHFGGMVDPSLPAAQVARIRALCYETCFVTGRRDDMLTAWISRLVEQQPVQAAFACSPQMARYFAHVPPQVIRIADYVDLESGKRFQRAASRSWPARLIDQRAARRLQCDEHQAACHADHVLFASSAAAARFAAQAPQHAARLKVVANGVDADHFSPHILHRTPFAPHHRVLVFAGAMDDWANAQAAAWFARHVFPALHQAHPALRFYVVGARPCAMVRSLGRARGVVVTGAVPDLRPYLAHAALVVAPLQSAHGLQNKVLEAMAMQKAVLATPAALAGLAVQSGTDVLQADAHCFGAAVESALADPAGLLPLAKAARERVLRDYGWPGQLEPLAGLLAAPPRLQGNGGGQQ